MITSPTSGRIRPLWEQLRNYPGGRRLFSIVLGRIAPYSGTIRPRVIELRDGYARVEMSDRRAVRNHLNSIHAIALMNLAELATGLALNYALPGNARAILTGLSIEFLKKGRGRLTAEATVPVPNGAVREELTLDTVVRDDSGEVVARAAARWLVGPKEEASTS